MRIQRHLLKPLSSKSRLPLTSSAAKSFNLMLKVHSISVFNSITIDTGTFVSCLDQTTKSSSFTCSSTGTRRESSQALFHGEMTTTISWIPDLSHSLSNLRFQAPFLNQQMFLKTLRLKHQNSTSTKSSSRCSNLPLSSTTPSNRGLSRSLDSQTCLDT